MSKLSLCLSAAAVCSFFLVGSVGAKRIPPKPVQAVVADGVRYSAPHFLPDKKQPGGFVHALDVKTGKLLWEVKVYQANYDENLERDVQDIFIVSLKLLNKTTLLVTAEGGRKYELDLTTRKVTKRQKKK